MIYPFQRLSDGLYVEAFYPMADAPEIGSTVQIDGAECRRLPSVVEQMNEKAVYFTSVQLPTGWKYAKDFDEHGSPRWSSKKALRESLARANAHGEALSWNQ
jgi:hypothetical protein